MMTKNRRAQCVLATLVLASAVSFGVSAQKPTPPPKKNPLLKLAEAWPTAEERQQRKLEAEARPLFAHDEMLEVTLVGDFKTINKDHDPKSIARYPGELRTARADGRLDTIKVEFGARGHVRRMARTCDFVPLRVAFPKDGTAGTVFERQGALKLVVQCAGGGDYEQYVLREYVAYKIFRLITPRSFRARLAKVTYVDQASGKTIGTRFGMFLEDNSDVARRMEGRAVELPRAQFKDLDMDTMMPMAVFNYMIGNTDYSAYALHNVVLVQFPPPDRLLYPIPYDFDISGLVHPPYAIPSHELMIKSVTDRLYRGPCRTQEQVDPIVANFNAKKDLVLALPESIPEMTKESRADAKSYLESFYSSIKNPKDVKRLFVAKESGGGCDGKPYM